jgi:dGTPase
MFTIADVRAAVPEFAEIHDQVENHFPGAPERVQFQEVERVLMDRMVAGLVNGTIEAAGAAGVRDHEEVRHVPNRVAAFTTGATDTTRRIKSFMHANVYNSEPLYSDRKRSAGMIADLFDYFLREPGSLPENYVEELKSQPLHRVVCDYIAGMTDRYFMRCYQEARLTPR